ncbi:MAG: class I SAM-dependent methyltransferase [Sphingomonadaceae bacterium]|nr:class I SAM-dependent methyltransferase [Sphingomonadaceae bacterium]
MLPVSADDVKAFWEANPLCAEAIPHELGTPAFFEHHERMRFDSEPAEVQERLYEWRNYAGKQLLDIGCGTGYVAALYAKGGANVTAVDIADQSVALTKKRLAWKGLSADVRQANAEHLPFEDNSFDVVTSFGVLHHTPDTLQALREVHRVLKPGGITHLMFYHKNSFAYRLLFPLKRLLQSEWRGKTAQDQVNAVDGASNPLGQVFTRDELTAMLPGFTDFKFGQWELFFAHQHRFPKPVRDWLSRNYGWFLYVKARKA